MKNKKTIKVLLPAVAIIWGVVLYQFITAFFPDESPKMAITTSSFKAPTFKPRDTFSLKPIDRDPFLGTSTRIRNDRPKSRVKSGKSPEPWPEISYQGAVTDNKGRSGIFMVTINGEQHLLRKGESASEVSVQRGSSTGVTLRYKGSSKKFSIE